MNGAQSYRGVEVVESAGDRAEVLYKPISIHAKDIGEKKAKKDTDSSENRESNLASFRSSNGVVVWPLSPKV